ncbi:hypothetical protein OS493_014722 [Desmophyllum pertusum]|uniref:Uncharacterized protein n=1 Tax=Desmophyllum pertusum TaxID=174260 RepID=A0A9W9YGI4_9CNID|nr:hypothetical protein OS493_014722 [Desmophyllum pertusum]
MDTIAETPDTSQTIAGITKLNNFEFTSTDSVTCWRAYGVGHGKVIKLDTSSSEPSHSRLEAAFSPGDFKALGRKATKTTTTSATASAEEVPADNPEESNKAEGVYACPQDGPGSSV